MQSNFLKNDTIVAQATAAGRGGVGIIRISGEKAAEIALAMLGKIPKARLATFSKFKDKNDTIIDEGIALFFPGPNSYTGEDTLELQGHGGPVVMDQLLRYVLAAGARLANPGEFTERAFLNNKLDLAQAEAVADLIDASSDQSAKMAIKSLQGEFSAKIHSLVQSLIKLRMYVEAAIDFPEEEIDFLADEKIKNDLEAIISQVSAVKNSAQQGVLMREGMTVVIAGKPNAGKSSLLNALCGRDTAIVTEIAGTTRDILREYIHLDGLPLHIIDTAGLRESDDKIEQEGMRRAWLAMENADAVLLVEDCSVKNADEDLLKNEKLKSIPKIIIKNKIDLLNQAPSINQENSTTIISLSAKQKSGIDLLKSHLKELIGFRTTTEGQFLARRRHIEAIDEADKFLQHGQASLTNQKAGELLAEDLRLAQNSLSQITGEFTSDDLLGEIFSNFCIGK